jgi:hypothetical protein
VWVGADAVFTLAIIAGVLLALWQSSDWPLEAKLVPHTAAYVVLLFASLNLVTVLFFTPAVGRTDGGGLGPRGLRHFGWLVAFLAVALLIGLLPGLFVLIVLQSRFEFGERWRGSAVAAAAMCGFCWLVFDRVFALPWPQSLIGDAFPALRASLGFV